MEVCKEDSKYHGILYYTNIIKLDTLTIFDEILSKDCVQINKENWILPTFY